LAQLVAVYRNPSYSPLQHRKNDTAIMDATIAELEAQGWHAMRITECDVERGELPPAELYLNMCQGARAAEQLMPLELDGTVLVNRPSSALDCHRHRLVNRLGGRLPAFPRTAIVASTAPHAAREQLRALSIENGKVWIKRGDVHAERPEDVVAVPLECLEPALAAFARRDIARVALQEHVPGPVVKFYGVADSRFFRWYDAATGPAGRQPAIHEGRLRELACEAAGILGLEVYGGDVAFPEPDRPVLIDLNDWPSFAPFRGEAARGIAEYVGRRVAQRRCA